MSIVIKGGQWKWANHSISEEPEDIELVGPTSEELSEVKAGDWVLIKAKLENNNGQLIACPVSLRVNKGHIVSILKEEGKKGCEDDRVQDLLRQIADITEKIAEHQNDINNALLDFLKSKER